MLLWRNERLGWPGLGPYNRLMSASLAPAREGVGRRRYEVFDVLRIGAALGVVFSHSFALAGEHEPTLTVGPMSFNFGALCVAVFFTISGYLISSSWDHDPNLQNYVRRRFARIWPGLASCLLVTALVVGPLVTELPVRSYLADRSTWTYVPRGLTLYLWRDSLPGVFLRNPFPVAVDGPLWTLPYEVLAYAALALIGLAGVLRHRWVMTTLGLAVFGAMQILVARPMPTPNLQVLNVAIQSALIFGTWFYAGVLLYLWRERLRTPIMLAASLFLVLSLILGLPLLFMGSAATLIVCVGSLQISVDGVTRFGDPSYGIYIYGWVVQETLARFQLNRGSAVGLFAEAAPLSVAIGYVSWHLVERPAMRRLRPKPRRVLPETNLPNDDVAGVIPVSPPGAAP